ncbi:hypothetical protein QFZ23_001974 [Arthrobacter globiformis]|uniref:hypothetical protein n=1 Tax=Arthrobacter globiformis TaxID=1665 RepID=UPI0027883AB1|nr:hypothetical protein [Arthrobacter globiformis]MDQ1058073.1 hypothetical protein [Arthrobacter globiformis]
MISGEINATQNSGHAGVNTGAGAHVRRPVVYEESGTFLGGQLTSSAWSGWWYEEPDSETWSLAEPAFGKPVNLAVPSAQDDLPGNTIGHRRFL